MKKILIILLLITSGCHTDNRVPVKRKIEWTPAHTAMAQYLFGEIEWRKWHEQEYGKPDYRGEGRIRDVEAKDLRRLEAEKGGN